jgi:cobalt-zinc-cadmium efflux system protein
MGEHPHTSPRSHGAAKRTLGIAVAITLLMGLVEVAGGLWSNSLALQGDAAHMFMDTAALSIALASLSVLAREPTRRQTFGYHRAEVLGALVNGLLLTGIAAYVVWRAYERLLDPAPVQGPLMLGVAVLGLAANGVALALVHRHESDSLGARGAFLHILSDAVTSVATIVAGLLVWLYGLTIADPLIALLIVAFILRGAFGLLRESAAILMEAAPRALDPARIEALLRAEPGVRGVHDVHAWSLTSGMSALTAHVEVDAGSSLEAAIALKERLKAMLAKEGVGHAVLELDRPHADAPSLGDSAGSPSGHVHAHAPGHTHGQQGR